MIENGVPEAAASAPDLAVVIVSHNSARWLERCLPSIFENAGEIALEVIVVDNDSADDTCAVAARFGERVRLVPSPNGGFGSGNNRGFEASNARYLLFLNPDTEIREGSLGQLVRDLDARPHVGLVGVRQVDSEGAVWPTIRRFPSLSRAVGEALCSERWPIRPSWSGERVLTTGPYLSETECDWTSGSFMAARREAFISAGAFDERFFLYCEEPDLCLRIRRAGWSVRYLPSVSIVHHAGNADLQARLVAQDAYARRQYARKHFSRGYAAFYVFAHGLRHLLRVVVSRRHDPESVRRRDSAMLSLRVLMGRAAPPFISPPPTARSSSSVPDRRPDSWEQAGERAAGALDR